MVYSCKVGTGKKAVVEKLQVRFLHQSRALRHADKWIGKRGIVSSSQSVAVGLHCTLVLQWISVRWSDVRVWPPEVLFFEVVSLIFLRPATGNRKELRRLRRFSYNQKNVRTKQVIGVFARNSIFDKTEDFFENFCDFQRKWLWLLALEINVVAISDALKLCISVMTKAEKVFCEWSRFASYLRLHRAPTNY